MRLWTDLIGWLRLVLTADPSARNMAVAGSGGGTGSAVGVTGARGAAIAACSGSEIPWTDSP